MVCRRSGIDTFSARDRWWLMRDINAAAVEFLKSALPSISNRVYSHAEPGSPTYPLIVVKDVSGPSDTGYLPDSRARVDHGAPTDSGYLAASDARLEIACFGDATLDSAKALWVEAHDALKNLVRGVYDDTLLLSAVRADGPTTELVGSSPVSSGEFVILAADTEVT